MEEEFMNSMDMEIMNIVGLTCQERNPMKLGYVSIHQSFMAYSS